ncbi:MAG: hypothetical protein AB1941_18875 [Gemmatimonadota bacterium]
MALRSFTAPDGTAWLAWKVTPATVLYDGPQRRTRDRRGQDVILYRGPERRVAERRRGMPTRPLLSSGLDRGWLAFEAESGGAKRRLCPPPDGWEQLPDAELVRLWHAAEPVRGPSAAVAAGEGV